MKKSLVISMLFVLTYGQMPTILKVGFDPFESKPYITVGPLPSTAVNINWTTRNAESSGVAYGSSALEDTIRLDGLRNFHHVRISYLRPGRVYYYQRLPSGDIRTFRTFPVHEDTYNFVVYGDTRSDSAAHKSIVDRITERSPAFVIHTGDLVEDGGSSDDWATFFAIENGLLQTTPILPVLGNHEQPFWQYDTLFALPGAEFFYSVNYAHAHFIFLDTQHELIGSQRSWLINDLIAAREDTSITWVFVAFHRPPYSSGSHGSQKDVRAAWGSIFERYRVDMVFTGHDHHYERTAPINGVIYLVVGGGGAPLYEVAKSPWTLRAESRYHLCAFNVTRNKLVLKTLGSNGAIFDSLVLEK